MIPLFRVFACGAVGTMLLVAPGCKRTPPKLDATADSLAIAEGVRIDTVRSDGTRPPLLPYAHDLEIAGTTDSTAPEFIYNTRLLEVAPDGRVAVNSWQRLTIFDSTGKFEWGTTPHDYRPGQLRNALALARKDRDGSVPRPNGWVSWITGSADGLPGQLADATTILFSGDTVAVYDLPTGLQVFNRVGRSLTISPIVPRHVEGPFVRLLDVGPTPVGWVALFRGMSARDGGTTVVLKRVSPATGALGATLTVVNTDATYESYGIAAGSFYTAAGNDFTINVHDGFGRLVKRLEVATTRVKVPDSIVARRIRSDVMRSARNTNSVRARQMLDSAVAVYASAPPVLLRVIGRLLVGHDGSIAVERADMSPFGPATGSDSTTFDILRADGTLRGRVRLPVALRAMAFSGTAIYCVEQVGTLPGSERIMGRSVPRTIERIVRLALPGT